MTLAAITAPAAGDESGLHDIINVDLKLREDRITNVRLLVSLSPLLPLLAKLVPSASMLFKRCRVIFEDSHGPEVDV
ncbi:hypothetical protein M404DRAFT_1009422 [Pisolithus tinctorius Marx 270]|uniref:Uncharacterized protein n=1 Tax=Pisolithus tinctorius Marx 270 TaxID=870435 RepID=A0A0C3NAV1_PISTI|nr:hypothetical protein M404DRAFT_1009422 [Pisolithus tinctorius Marx 270]